MTAITNIELQSNLTGLRLEQANLLRQRVFSSCLIVQFIISYTAIIIWITGIFFDAALWFLSASAMVFLTYAYARFKAPEGIGKTNFESYLRGHIIVSSLTGMVWGGFAIYVIDFGSEFTVFLACLLVSSITMGGVLPSSIYRPSYIGLSVFSVPPVALYLVIAAPNPFSLVGLGMMVYFLFAMFISARVEIETRETIAARHARDLNEKVAAQSKMIQRASEEKTRFLAATGHDLSQPLHAQGFFMQALRPLLTTSDQHHMLDKIKDSWNAQSELARGIVDISRIDSGAIIAQRKSVNLAQVAEKLAEEFMSTGNKSLTLNSDFESLRVNTDPTLLERILRNILSNAQKYTPTDGIVDFTVEQSGDSAKVSIRNSGPGIPKDDQDRIFDEYVQLEDHGQRSGLGLGLSIVRRLTNLLDIDLTLESSPELGTNFTLTLPLSDSIQQNTTSEARPLLGFTGSPLIVLVDDEKAIRQSMGAVLSAWNCQLITGCSSAETLDLVSKTNEIPALLVIDRNLGNGENGLDLIQLLRDEVNEQTPAILMSGDLSDLEDSDLITDVRLMNKPVAPEEIRQIINELLHV